MSEKSCNFALFFSNLYCVKLYFMKDKENYYKLVYHFVHGNLYKILNTDRSFHIDFPRVHALFSIDHCTNVEILDNKHNTVKIWKDKYGNIVVRYYLPKIHTKINF